MSELTTGRPEAAASETGGYVRSREHSFYKMGLKRILDLTLVIALLPVALPMVALFWGLVRLDGGPGFYAQDRVGRNGKVFKFWKLRTMVVDAEKRLADLCASDPDVAREWRDKQKLENDPRITRVGLFLRCSFLDELPQLFNVFLGEMSFVGPRPFMVSQRALYEEAGGRAYFNLRPGITGLWQVGERTGFLQRIELDDLYHDTLSLVGDLEIFYKTFGVVFKRAGR